NVLIGSGGRQQVLADWAAETDLPAQVIFRRIYQYGWREDGWTSRSRATWVILNACGVRDRANNGRTGP
ncbi:MAG TPA: hypothetical protein VN648_07885, partial [Candidatus Methylomirabilis sp.]|nr:hypothetical protein [Candidatus Methylomirabilis sp.]